jgi:DNA mismatch repair ATPase MutS
MAFTYESQYSTKSRIVLVDSERYGSVGGWDDNSEHYYPSEDHNFLNSTGVKNLDLQVILDRVGQHIKGLGVSRSTEIVGKYFIPTQDSKELTRRQDAVRSLYENSTLYDNVQKLIVSADNLSSWNSRFVGGGEGDFEKMNRQVGYLVDMVESGLDLDSDSEVFWGVRDFMSGISEVPEYAVLKNYSEEGLSTLLEEYQVDLDVLAKKWYIPTKGSLTSLGLIDLFRDTIEDGDYKNIMTRLDVESRRDIYKSLVGLRDVFGNVLSNSSLEGLVDCHESETFGLAGKFDEVIDYFGKTAVLTFTRPRKINAKERTFLKGTAELLTHVQSMFGEGLSTKMKALEVRTGDLVPELSFYAGLVGLAHDMKDRSKIVMPTVHEKDRRSTKIVGGDVPSFIIRSLGDKSEKLVSNDVTSGRTKSFVITGANDNGKTSYIRMIPQQHVLAQVGSYVPATSAMLSIVDGIFSAFSKNDKAGKEGTFRAGLSYLSFITNPQGRDWNGLYELNERAIKESYAMCDHSFLTPYSLAVLDEIGIGSDSESTGEALEKLLQTRDIGATMYVSTHHHPIAEAVERREYSGVMNLAAVLKSEKGKMVETYKIVRGRRAPSDGSRLFLESGFTKEKVVAGREKLQRAGIIK